MKKELRIGNWEMIPEPDSKYKNYVWDQVKEIHTDVIITELSQFWSFRGILYEDVKFIELTPEILERVGFENLQTKGFSLITIRHNTYKIIHLPTRWVLVLQGKEDLVLAHFNNLHQLQNLIFSLTGEELILK